MLGCPVVHSLTFYIHLNRMLKIQHLFADLQNKLWTQNATSSYDFANKCWTTTAQSCQPKPCACKQKHDKGHRLDDHGTGHDSSSLSSRTSTSRSGQQHWWYWYRYFRCQRYYPCWCRKQQSNPKHWVCQYPCRRQWPSSYYRY